MAIISSYYEKCSDTLTSQNYTSSNSTFGSSATSTTSSGSTFTYDTLKDIYNSLGIDINYQTYYRRDPLYYHSGIDLGTGSDQTIYMYNPYKIEASPFYNFNCDNTSQISNHIINRKDRLRQSLRKNLSPDIIIRGNGINKNISDNEKVAIESLREELTEAEYKRYLKYGFINVKASSGKIYQIFRKNWHTKVWLGNKLVEEVCVRLVNTSKVPPTDNVIAFKRMVEIDEDSFRKSGNVYKFKKTA